MRRHSEHSEPTAFEGWSVKPRGFIMVLNGIQRRNNGFALRNEELNALKGAGKAKKVGALDPVHLGGDTTHPHYLASEGSNDASGCSFRFNRFNRNYRSSGMKQFLEDKGFHDETPSGMMIEVFPM